MPQRPLRVGDHVLITDSAYAHRRNQIALVMEANTRGAGRVTVLLKLGREEIRMPLANIQPLPNGLDVALDLVK